MSKYKDTRLTILDVPYQPDGSGRRRELWLCECDCGIVKRIRADGIRAGRVVSCGCYNREQRHIRTRTHGATGTVEYNLYKGMLNRCYNERYSEFHNYGGRGIIVCDEWRGREGFKNWFAYLGPRPSSDYTLEREDNDGNYEPGNVKWATYGEQSRNRRNTHRITFNDKTQCLTDWSTETGIKVGVLYYRLTVLGWSIERTLTTPALEEIPRDELGRFTDQVAGR